MSDKPTKPTPDADDQNETKGGFALPKSQQLSTTQHVFIWLLVIVVGVLFGMGSTVPMLGEGGARNVGSVSENEILMRQNVARRLQEILNPQRMQGGEQFEPSSYDRNGRQQDVHQIWADRIKLARYAEKQGLMPGGKALDDIVKEFLNRPLPTNPQKRYVNALEEAKTSDKAVSLEELSRQLKEDRARELVSAANVVTPAVPAVMADAIAALPPLSQMDYYSGKRGDQVVVDEVIITAKHLLPDIKDDDVEIQAVYDRLKGTQFNRPTALQVTVAYVDVPALTLMTTVPDRDIEAYYNAHKDDYRKPVEAPKPEEAKPTADKAATDAAKTPETPKAPEPPKVEYKALAEVSAEIKTKLAKERAELKAKELVKAFDAAAETILEQKDNAGFKALATKMNLATRENIRIEEPASGGTLNAGEFGMLSETQLHLFTQELNAVTSAVQSTGENAKWLVLRLDARHEAGFKDLTDPTVKEQVIKTLKGERTYKDFITKAEAIRAEAEKMGPGGLKKWSEQEAAKIWEAKLTSNTISSLQQIAPPPAELKGLAAGDAKLLAAMAMPDRPVALGTSPAQSDIPAVRLVQVTGYQAAPPSMGEQRIQHANTYRSMLEVYRYGIFNTNLTTELRDQ